MLCAGAGLRDKGDGQPDKSRKLSVPADATQEKAKKLVADLFKDELGKAKTPAVKQSLAKKLPLSELNCNRMEKWYR